MNQVSNIISPIARSFKTIFKTRFRVIFLIGCFFLSSNAYADTEPGNNTIDGAELKQLGESVSGSVDYYGGDPGDWYVFNVPVDGSLLISASYTVGTTNWLGITATNACGTTYLYTTFPDVAGNFNLGRIKAGTYYVCMFTGNTGTGGLFNYSFSVILDTVEIHVGNDTIKARNDIEINDTKPFASHLAIGDTVNLGNISFVSDCFVGDFSDYYKFTTNRLRNFNVNAHLAKSIFDPGNIEPVLELIDSVTSLQLAVSPSTQTTDLNINIPLDSGTYYLWLRQNGAGCGYRINYSLLPLVDSITFINKFLSDMTLIDDTLYHGSPLDTLSPIKICTDGSTATYITVHATSALIPPHISFRILDENGYISADPSRYGSIGNIIINENEIAFAFHHPTYMDLNQLYRPCSLQILFDGKPVDSIHFPIHFYRAPIVFVHGFLGSSSTFNDMKSDLTGSSLYPSSIIYNANYWKTSCFPFSANRKIVQSAINNVLLQARNGSFSAGKVILISHSMGGILSRLYLQSSYPDCSYRNDIEKIITLNTPHYGTQFANNGLTNLTLIEAALYISQPELRPWVSLAGLGIQPFLGAIKDMRVNSTTILTKLNIPPSSQARVSSVTLSTDETGNTSLRAAALKGLFFYAFQVQHIYHGDINDIIVPLKSQQAGIMLMPTVTQQWHIGSSSNGSIIDQVKSLVDADPSGSSFTSQGFLNDTLTYPRNLNPDSNLIILSNQSADSIKITNPASGNIFNAGDNVTADIYYTSNIARMTLVVYGSSIEPITIETNSVNQLNFQIPNNAIGELNLILIGGGSTGLLAQDTIHIFVSPTSIADSIKASPTSINLALGLFGTPAVSGYFNSAGTSVNLTNAPGLSVQYDSNFLTYDGHNSFQGIDTGITKIIYSYQGFSDSVFITIYNDPSVLTCSFEPSSDNIFANDSVIFYNQSSGLAVSYQWTFPGGTPSLSTLENPVIKYLLPGVYPVSLKTTFVNGTDSLILDSLIHVEPIAGPIYTFTGNGDWNTATNWFDNLIPPSSLPVGTQIRISPEVGGECILSGQVIIPPGVIVTIALNAKLRILGDLIIVQ